MKARLSGATLGLAAAVVAVFAVELEGDGMALCHRFGFVSAHPSFGGALASLFLHDPDHMGHVAGNLVMLLVIGAVVEPALGPWRMVALFVACGLAGALTHLLGVPGSEIPLIGMSGGLCGLMAVAAVVRPRLMLCFVASYMGMTLLALFVSTPFVPDGVSVGDHVGGFIVGAGTVLLGRAHRVRWAPA